ncbi:MAG: hypothetical protein M0D54_18940 [Hyphomonadaceae bacterium JAD_PAG50586_4]|nr:MAG: hypothetical protein M0D54_18940 [Hyphomonadaceae bacterium JAD_PAG50586_4]
MRFRFLFVAVALAVSGCASTQNLLTYPAGWSDADVMVGRERYQIWFHERQPTVLVQRGEPRPLGQMIAQNMTVRAADQSPGILIWGAAANAVLNQIGCGATEVTGADQMREISYTCQPGVNVSAEVAARREEWRRGVVVAAPAAN